jgi:hypothetical protein
MGCCTVKFTFVSKVFAAVIIRATSAKSSLPIDVLSEISDSHGGEYEDHSPDDEGSRHLRNVGISLPEYTTQHHRT